MKITFNQLKKMILESENGDFFVWSIYTLKSNGYSYEEDEMVEGSKKFATEEEAYNDGIEKLKKHVTGHYCLEVWNRKGNLMKDSYAEIKDGEFRGRGEPAFQHP